MCQKMECSGFSENVSRRLHLFGHLILSLWCCLERFVELLGVDIAGGSMSLGEGFEFLNLARFLGSLCYLFLL